MSQSNSQKLYSYYQSKNILPTYAQFLKPEELNKYKQQRSKFFLEKLYLPAQIFKGASLVEFGPDSGENALVFADWGAEVSLVEPNPNAWPQISDNFAKFGLNHKLRSLAKVGLEDFKTEEKFQFIVAEGFIYTLRPQSVWIDVFSRILDEQGFFIISYGELFGELMELFLKLVHSRFKSLSGLDSRQAARKLFQAKWDAISHTRSFDSWAMDILENPFARLKYYFKADQLCRELFSAGFSLYSSWPNYKDNLDVHWHKKEVSPSQQLIKNTKFISRSILSFAFGRKLFLASESDQPAKSVKEILERLVCLFDQLIDKFDSRVLEQACTCLGQIKSFIKQESIVADSAKDKEDVSGIIESLLKILILLREKDIPQLTDFCSSDPAFIDFWGQPCHYAVFRKNE